MPTFTIAPDFGVQATIAPKVRYGEFGDGYIQRVAQGINSMPEKWSLTFSGRTASELSALLTFLKTQGGVASFDWTSPSGTVGKWICPRWTYTPTTAVSNTVTAEFQQVYE